jgi:formate-dependent nitrite reductase membrane component NrfD
MQATRQWMVIHEWMLKGNRQTEWIENRGILLWLAFYTGGLGGGLYLVSLFFNNMWGMLIGWFIVAVLKGSFHLIFLGKPARFWRLLFHPQTSWLSRGLFFVFGFSGLGLLQLLTSQFLPDQTVMILVLKICAGVFALCVATYTGFVLNTVKGVPFWSLPILPLLFVTCGILGGFGLTVAIGLSDTSVNMVAAEAGSRWMLLINAALIVIYLLVALRKDPVGKQSVLLNIKGGIAKIFWPGVIILGIIIPFLVALFGIITEESAPGLIITGTICEVLGGMLLRYCILKSAIYSPIISIKAFNRSQV